MKYSICTLALVAVLFSACGESRDDRPNIILITLDTTRAGHLSCLGYHRKTTPNLDRLAEEGQLVRNCVAVSSWTLPTHASIFTGLFPSTHGAYYAEGGDTRLTEAFQRGNTDAFENFEVNRLPEGSVTLAEVLREAGYATAGLGGGPWLKPVFGLAQGFDYYDCNVDSPVGRRADEISRVARFLIRRNRDVPFFLFLNYFDPHGPYTPPDHVKDRFVDSENLSAAESLIAHYDAEIFFMDEEIGRVVEELKKQGLYEKTWIIVVPDHGELLEEHGLSGHGYTLYESVVKSPLILKWPENWAPLPSTEERCQQVDLLPTVIERLGLRVSVKCDGHPLGKVEHPIVCELNRSLGNVKMNSRFDRDLKAVYWSRYKLIVSTRERDRDAGLFDLDTDSGEVNDLTSSLPDVARQLKSLLAEWKERLQAPLEQDRVESIDPKTLDQLKGLGYGK